jgi:hypothetical protein
LALLPQLTFAQVDGVGGGAVDLIPFASKKGYPDAAAPKAISFACSDNAGNLKVFFRQRGLPFEADLVHPGGKFAACHVYYEPTLRDFRASVEDQPIQRLYVAVDPLNFFADAEFGGSSLDIAKTVLGKLPRSVDVRLSVSGGFPKELWQPTTAYHFGGTPHRLDFFDTGLEQAHPWTQDHLESGTVRGERRVLIPRHLYEGRPEDGAKFESLLHRLEEPHVVRSKLSWEGGDLQFVANPQDPSRIILVHGATARIYWGPELTAKEYSYVLRVEFGADDVLDLSQLGPHADYLVAFLPADRTALVSQLVSGSPEVARAAAFELVGSFAAAPPEFRALAAAAADWDGPEKDDGRALIDSIAAARRKLGSIADASDPQITHRLNQYITKYCPANPEGCFDVAGTVQMLDQDRELLRASISQDAAAAINELLRPLLLDLIEAQVVRPEWRERLLDEAASKLQGWGFRVVRVPHLAAKTFHTLWPGVSYANMLVFDRRLFVPTLGLGEVEENFIAKLRSDLHGAYDIVPVDARASLINNGGVHCVFGIIR